MTPYTQCKPLRPEETFRFECRQCGECCRHVKAAVMIESLDLFKLARHFNLDTADVANWYLEAVTIEWGAPILVLKTKQHEDACVFLKAGKCSIQAVKPRVCRLYPLSVGPDDKNPDSFLFFNVSDQEHHFHGPEYRIGDWTDTNFNEEDREYIKTEYRAIHECGKLMKRIPREYEDRVIFQMLRYRYFQFETDEDFLRQYALNMAFLKRELQALVKD
jgi:Fe-S-cluster containining protein